MGFELRGTVFFGGVGGAAVVSYPLRRVIVNQWNCLVEIKNCPLLVSHSGTTSVALHMLLSYET